MVQVILLILGGAAIWLVGRRSVRWRRWGFVAGALSQPFWIVSALEAKQWGILVLSIWYAYAWIDGGLKAWREHGRTGRT